MSRPIFRSTLAMALLLGLTMLACTLSSRSVQAQSDDVRSERWTQSTVSDFQTGEGAKISIIDTVGGELRLTPGATTGTYTSPAVTAAWTFNAIAPCWKGDVPAGASLLVEIRVTTAGDSWSPWYPFDDSEWIANQELFCAENPLLLAGGEQFQYRVTMTTASTGAPTDATSPLLSEMALIYIDATAGPTTDEARATAMDGEMTAQGVPKPSIISRAGWGANESYRFWSPTYRAVAKIIVHHTVTPNNYREDESAARVRAIYYYHAVTLGWGDIGYNYLVDRYGNVFEGRYGGPGVVAGHTYGYNSGSMGVSVIGTYGNATGSMAPTEASLSALANLCAWEASRSYIHPLESSFFKDIVSPNLGGHRDYGSSECPGDYLYAELTTVRQRVWERMASYTPQYNVEWLDWQDLPSLIQANQTYSLTVRVRNTGWLNWPRGSAPNPVRLGYHWLDSHGQRIVQPPQDDHRTPLAYDVSYGYIHDLAALVTTPITPGVYTLEWDMVHEGVFWFHDANPSSPVLTMTVTSTPPIFIRGQLLDALGRPVQGGQVSVSEWITTAAGADGSFVVALPAHQTFTVTARAGGYAPSLPAYNVDATGGDAALAFFLVPHDLVDRVVNGDMEDGLEGWTVGSLSTEPPTITQTAHTGAGAVQLGSILAGTAWLSQSVTLHPSSPAAALSLLYAVPAAGEGAVFQVILAQLEKQEEPPLTYTLPLTAAGWTHFWAELPPGWVGPVDLRLELDSNNTSTPTIVLVDEVRFGYRTFDVYLPSVSSQKEE